jgi:radical SAM superfamily enzyme YgiQ (UPF0313 family)
MSPFFTYDFPPFRPPNEAQSALIRITRGCPWNRCEFCAMYKRLAFEQKPIEKIKEDVRLARKIYGNARSVFLGDSDNLVHRYLPEIVSFIRKIFPEAERVTSYARAKTVLRNKREDLVALRQAGLDRLHLGLESGDAATLKFLRKGATPEQMIRAGQKAGFEVSFYVMSGAGGRKRWKEHAQESARVLKLAGPDFIRLRTLTILPETPLDEKLRRGEFIPSSPEERLQEIALFIQSLHVKDCYLASDHLTNYLWAGHTVIYRGVSGRLPQDKPAMLEEVHQALLALESSPLPVKDSNHLYREGLISSL